jgi:nucleotide-binding universal stress UspA family protein
VTKLSRILCAVDFSEPAQAAFRQALALSRARGAELAVVMTAPANDPLRMRPRKRAAEIAALRRASAAAGVLMSVSVHYGNPVATILAHAEAGSCDLIVLGPHDRTRFERFRSGSVAEQVTRGATCPVLTVPALAHDGDHDTTSSFANVLCPMDFSNASTAALEHALRIVGETRGRLTLVHVLPSLHLIDGHAYHLTGPDYVPLLTRNAWQLLQECVPPQLSAATDVRARVLFGPAAAQIVRVSREIDADLIVMGVTARGAIGRRLLGSTAARVMRSAGRPLLAVPEGMHEAAMVHGESDAVQSIAA